MFADYLVTIRSSLPRQTRYEIYALNSIKKSRYMYTYGYVHCSLLLVQKETRVSKKARDDGGDEAGTGAKEYIIRDARRRRLRQVIGKR